MLVIDDDMNILLTRGDSATIDLTIYNSDGTVYTPSGDDHVIFSVKKVCSSPLLLNMSRSKPLYNLSNLWS